MVVNVSLRAPARYARAAFASTALLLSSLSCASAADLGPYRPYRAPEPAPVYDAPAPIWQGAYIGANVGYGFGSRDTEGIIGGGQLGYNWQFDRFVLGVEGDIQASDMTGDQSHIDGTGVTRTSHVSNDWYSTVRGRVGYAMGPALLYATGGVAFGNFDHQYSLAGPVNVTLSDSGLKTGYAVGGGVEYKFNPRWSVKAEYLFLDFGQNSVTGIGSDGLAHSARFNDEEHTVRLGVNYKF